MIKSGRITWWSRKHEWGYKNALKILVGKPEGKRPLDLDVDSNITLKRILHKRSLRVWTGFIWLGIRIGGRLL
jgi:hypothetical protein